jgi:hypothetical protein
MLGVIQDHMLADKHFRVFSVPNFVQKSNCLNIWNDIYLFYVYGCYTLFLSLKEEYGLMVFEGRLGCIFGVEGSLSRKKGKLGSVDVHYFCFSVRSSRPNEYSRTI